MTVRDRMSLEVQLAPYILNSYIQVTPDKDDKDGIPATVGYPMDALGLHELGEKTGDDPGNTIGAQACSEPASGIFINDGEATGVNG